MQEKDFEIKNNDLGQVIEESGDISVNINNNSMSLFNQPIQTTSNSVENTARSFPRMEAPTFKPVTPAFQETQ